MNLMKGDTYNQAHTLAEIAGSHKDVAINHKEQMPPVMPLVLF